MVGSNVSAFWLRCPQRLAQAQHHTRPHLARRLPLYHQKLHELVHSGKPVDGILRLRRSDDAVIYCTFKAAMLREGERNKIAGTFQDITKLIEMQKDLEKAKRSAEASDRSKSYFLAQASHDLRQPMQALRIFISTLEEEPLDNRQKELLGKISASADNLNNLLDNLLDISKLDSEGFEACLGNFDISDLLKNIFLNFTKLRVHAASIFIRHSATTLSAATLCWLSALSATCSATLLNIPATKFCWAAKGKTTASEFWLWITARE